MAEPTTTETLKQVGEQALISLISGVTEAANFLKGEIPIAVRELLTYYTVYYSLGTALVVAWVVGTVWLVKWRIRREDGFFDDPTDVFFALLAIVTFVFLPMLAMEVVPQLLKVTLAPRIWLIEYAAGLMK